MYVLPILNVKFPSLFKFMHLNSAETIEENKKCSWVAEEKVFCNFELIMTYTYDGTQFFAIFYDHDVIKSQCQQNCFQIM